MIFTKPLRIVAYLPVITFSACATPAKWPDSKLQLLSTEPPRSSIHAEDLIMLQPGELQFMLIEPRKPHDEQITIACSTTDQFNAEFAIRLGDFRTQFLRQNEAGDMELVAAIDHKEQVVTFFHPPLIVAWRELAAGETLESESQMRVFDLKNKNKLREQGSCHRKVTYAQDQWIRTPTGSYRTKRVDVQFDAELQLADVNESTTLFLHPEVNIMVEDSVETVRLLGVTLSADRRTLIRNEFHSQ